MGVHVIHVHCVQATVKTDKRKEKSQNVCNRKFPYDDGCNTRLGEVTQRTNAHQDEYAFSNGY